MTGILQRLDAMDATISSIVHGAMFNNPMLVVAANALDGSTPIDDALLAAADYTCVGINDQDTINTAALEASAQGRSVKLVGWMEVTFVENPDTADYWSCLWLPSRCVIDLRDAYLNLDTSAMTTTVWPGSTMSGTKKTNCGYYRMVCNANLNPSSFADTDQGIIIIGGVLDGNSDEIQAIGTSAGQIGHLSTSSSSTDGGLQFEGVDFRHAMSCQVIDTVATAIRGTSGGGGANESFAFNAFRSADITFDHCFATNPSGHTYPTATGFAANYSENVRWENCVAQRHGLNLAGGQTGHGFSMYQTFNSKRINCESYLNAGSGARDEYGADNSDVTCRWGHWDDLPNDATDSAPAYQNLRVERGPNGGDGMVTLQARRYRGVGTSYNGNTGFGIVTQYSIMCSLSGCFLIGNTEDGFNQNDPSSYTDERLRDPIRWSTWNIDESNVFALNKGGTDDTEGRVFGAYGGFGTTTGNIGSIPARGSAYYYGANANTVGHSGVPDYDASGAYEITPTEDVWYKNVYPFPMEVQFVTTAGTLGVQTRRNGRARYVAKTTDAFPTMQVVVQPNEEWAVVDQSGVSGLAARIRLRVNSMWMPAAVPDGLP